MPKNTDKQMQESKLSNVGSSRLKVETQPYPEKSDSTNCGSER